MSQLVTISPQPEPAPSILLVDQEERADPKDLQSGSPSVIMPSTGFSKPSPTTGFVGTKPPVIEIPASPVSSPPSDEEVNYSEYDFNLVMNLLLPIPASSLT